MIEFAPTFAATCVLAWIFVHPFPRQVLSERQPGFRSLVSFAAGVSVAYVFIDLLPELDEASVSFEALAEEIGVPLAEFSVHLAALLGFVLFYGLERLVRWKGAAPQEEGEGETDERAEFLLKFWGSSAYVFLIAYLIQERYGDRGEQGLILYAVAMTFHFVALRHSLRYEFTRQYDGGWRWLFAGACFGGWFVSAVVGSHELVVGLLLGFLGGMLIMNTTVMELPSEKEGRFIPFIAGSLLYALLLTMV